MNKDYFLVSNCLFNVNDKQSSSIYYYAGIFGSRFEVNNCVFNGDLQKDVYHIERSQIDNNSPKLKVKYCNFSIDHLSPLNMKNRFLKVNLKEQIFNSKPDQKESKAQLFQPFYYIYVLLWVIKNK